jgi:hypothetical protein
MTHPDILAALARERVSTFLSEAQAARQASLARAARSPARGKRVVLRDGSTALIRPVRSTDTLLARLSDRARQAGIDHFTALVSTQNAAIAGLLRKVGACLIGRGPGMVEYEVALVIPPGDPGYDQTPQPVSQRC